MYGGGQCDTRVLGYKGETNIWDSGSAPGEKQNKTKQTTSLHNARRVSDKKKKTKRRNFFHGALTSLLLLPSICMAIARKRERIRDSEGTTRSVEAEIASRSSDRKKNQPVLRNAIDNAKHSGRSTRWRRIKTM